MNTHGYTVYCSVGNVNHISGILPIIQSNNDSELPAIEGFQNFTPSCLQCKNVQFGRPSTKRQEMGQYS